jgi:hypothetical protein
MARARAQAVARDSTPGNTNVGTTSLPSSSSSTANVKGSDVPAPAPVPSFCWFRGDLGPDERLNLQVLLEMWEQEGRTEFPRSELPDLPPGLRPSVGRVRDDLAFCSDLLRAAGDDGTVYYAVDWAAGRLGLSSGAVSEALRTLRQRRLVRLVKTLPRVEGRRAGGRIYAVAKARFPGGALAVEADLAGSGRVDERQEARERVPVRQAVADDCREVAEGDGRLGASGDGASAHGPHRMTGGRRWPG